MVAGRERHPPARPACPYTYRAVYPAPPGYECQIRPRSGLALKHGLTVLNTPGTIDADYRGEIGIILINLGEYDYEVKDGERICQMVVKSYSKVEWQPVERLDRTEREDGAFGHTGVD